MKNPWEQTSYWWTIKSNYFVEKIDFIKILPLDKTIEAIKSEITKLKQGVQPLSSSKRSIPLPSQIPSSNGNGKSPSQQNHQQQNQMMMMQSIVNVDKFMNDQYKKKPIHKKLNIFVFYWKK